MKGQKGALLKWEDSCPFRLSWIPAICNKKMDALNRLKNLRLELHNKNVEIINKRVELAELEKELLDIYNSLDHTKKEIEDATRSET